MENQCNTDNLDKWTGVIIVKNQDEIMKLYTEKQKIKLNNQMNEIFNEHWNLRDIKCKSASCVWIDGEKVKEKVIELFEGLVKNEK